MPPDDPPPHEPKAEDELSAEELPEFLRDYRPVDRSA
jgi:hypothetical protein